MISVAIALPEKFVGARASDMNRSTATDQTDTGQQIWSVRREVAAEGGQPSAGDTGGTMIMNSSVSCSGMKCRGVAVRRRRRRTLGSMTR